MDTQYKAGIAVLVIALAFFIIAKPLFRQFMSEADFSLRRNAWLGLNAIAFASPSFWLYVAGASLILLRATKKDSNPAALYMFLLLAMAPVGQHIPTFGIINTLFNLDHLRLLSIVVLLPMLLQNLQNAGKSRGQPASSAFRGIRAIDLLVITYCVIQIVLMFPYSSLTVSLRRCVLLGLEILLPYFALSRALRDRSIVTEALAAFALSMMLLAPMGLLEMYWKLMLYATLQEAWNTPTVYIQLLRSDLLRALVTAGNSIVFGYCMAIGLIIWFALLHRVRGALWRWGGVLLLAAGLVASFSRGPWVGAAAGLMALLAFSPLGAQRILKVLLLTFALGCAVLISPLGDRVLDYLPFIGTQEEGTITYRQRLFEISLMLIADSPLTGNPFFIQYMEELRQGQGIIDLVNALVTIALSYGLLGLGAFLGVKLTVLWRCYGLRKHPIVEVQWTAAAIAASIVASLVIICTVASFLSVPYVFWSLAALGAALVSETRVATRHVADDWAGPKPAAVNTDRRRNWNRDPAEELG